MQTSYFPFFFKSFSLLLFFFMTLWKSKQDLAKQGRYPKGKELQTIGVLCEIKDLFSSDSQQARLLGCWERPIDVELNSRALRFGFKARAHKELLRKNGRRTQLVPAGRCNRLFEEEGAGRSGLIRSCSQNAFGPMS